MHCACIKIIAASMFKFDEYFKLKMESAGLTETLVQFTKLNT